MILILARSMLTILLLVAGSDAAFRPVSEFEKQLDARWPGAFDGRDQREGVILAIVLLIVIAWTF